MTVAEGPEVAAHLGGLESIWDEGMRDAYAFYGVRAGQEVALAAAMVEAALDLQHLGATAPDPARLLLGDLCLARASRLLAATRDTHLQIGFARAVERVAAAAAGGPPARPLRELLTAAIGEAG
ncbi:MAG TPA: hypothetical protein VKF59_19060 [Candidatus Dormibacteraeota bacterium]|nr:hypothetical protein [Candidatus Dormibacteraeota bacterium]